MSFITTTQTVLLITGMRDNEDREHVIEALAGVEGVVEIDVSLRRTRAVVHHRIGCKPKLLIEAVMFASFRADIWQVDQSGAQ